MDTSLPVREMVLYKHGVGFFMREGNVSTENVILSFHQDEINDVLKSLTVFDKAGGQVLGIHYQTPMDKAARLANSSIRLSDYASLRELVRDLRGRQVALTFQKAADSIEQVTGHVVGINEPAQHPSSSNTIPTRSSILVMTAENKVRIFPLDALSEVAIQDTQAEHDLRYFLTTSVREDTRRSVLVRLSQGEHQVVVQYVAPTPTWRVSYRVIAQSDAANQIGKALIQGWGLFDNRLEEDLDQVQVTLVAGQPISFIYDLYASQIPERPTVQDENRVAPGPVQYSGGGSLLRRIGQDAAPSAPTTATGRLGRYASAPTGGKGLDNLKARLQTRLLSELDPSMDTRSPDIRRTIEDLFEQLLAEENVVLARGEKSDLFNSVLADTLSMPASELDRLIASTPQAASTEDSGEFFQYVVSEPVSVKRGESALVPIIRTQIQYDRELLYNQRKLPSHPAAALRFQNTTGLTLEHGPVTVVEDGDYKGEAVIPFTKDGNEVYLPYAVELGVRVTERYKTSSEVAGLTISQAYLVYEQYLISSTTYIVENTTARALTVTIEAPIAANYELVETRAPDVQTAVERRWRVAVPERSRVEFVRKERQRTRRQEELRRLDYAKLEQFLEQRWLDRSTLDLLREMLDTLDRLKKLRADQDKLIAERNTIYARQEQIRLNLGALQATQDELTFRNRLLKQLEANEDRIEEIAKRVNELTDEMTSTERKVQQIIDGLG